MQIWLLYLRVIPSVAKFRGKKMIQNDSQSTLLYSNFIVTIKILVLFI